MSATTRPRIAMIGSYVPRRCGIATFTHDISAAIHSAFNSGGDTNDGPLPIVALNDTAEGYPYGPEVVVEIDQHRRDDYRNAADILNTSKVDVVVLQHEYGLFGGESGEYLFELLDRLRKPLV